MTPAGGKVEPRTTVAVILGASVFPKSVNLESLPAFKNSAIDFGEYLLNEAGFNLPRDNLLNLFDSELPPSLMLENIASFLTSQKREQHEGSEMCDLLLYYTGHGGFTGDKESTPCDSRYFA